MNNWSMIRSAPLIRDRYSNIASPSALMQASAKLLYRSAAWEALPQHTCISHNTASIEWRTARLSLSNKLYSSELLVEGVKAVVAPLAGFIGWFILQRLQKISQRPQEGGFCGFNPKIDRLPCLQLIWDYVINSVLMTLTKSNKKSWLYIYLFVLIARLSAPPADLKLLLPPAPAHKNRFWLITLFKGDRIWWPIKSTFC